MLNDKHYSYQTSQPFKTTRFTQRNNRLIYQSRNLSRIILHKKPLGKKPSSFSHIHTYPRAAKPSWNTAIRLCHFFAVRKWSEIIDHLSGHSARPFVEIWWMEVRRTNRIKMCFSSAYDWFGFFGKRWRCCDDFSAGRCEFLWSVLNNVWFVLLVFPIGIVLFWLDLFLCCDDWFVFYANA